MLLGRDSSDVSLQENRLDLVKFVDAVPTRPSHVEAASSGFSRGKTQEHYGPGRAFRNRSLSTSGCR